MNIAEGFRDIKKELGDFLKERGVVVRELDIHEEYSFETVPEITIKIEGNICV